MADTFHQAAVAGNHIGKMVNKAVAESRCEMTFRHGKANAICNALPKRASCCLNACCVTGFWMTGCSGAQLPEVPQLLDRHIGIAG